MDRPEPGLVKWSPRSSVDSFVHISLQHRFVQLYEPTGYAHKQRFDYSKLSRHDDFPPLTTYDWSPANPSLLAVGTGSGVINLLKIDDNSNAYAEIGFNSWRTCQAVAFNTTGLIAVGLDRVRLDQSLHVWDVNRLSAQELSKTGFPSAASRFVDSYTKREASVSVSSLKFFEDSPLTLVAGVKGQGVRIIDLRDPTGKVTFQTKCNNNLAIDYVDQNNFASSALDHPGVMIWDRRAASEPLASHFYSQAVQEEVVPWGGALQLDKVIETDSDPFLVEGKHSLIRSLRFCRGRRGLLGALSPTGQLKVLETKKEIESAGMAPQQGPELLQVQRSHEMDISYRYNSRRNDRIVSFDWVTLPSLSLRPRMLVLRANGVFGILEQSSTAADHVYKLIPWQSPHRGLEENAPYHDIMQFEPTEEPEILGPLLTEKTLAAMPIFGPDKAHILDRLDDMLQDIEPAPINVQHVDETSRSLLPTLRDASTISRKLLAIRAYIKNEQAHRQAEEGQAPQKAQKAQKAQEASSGRFHNRAHEISLAPNSLGSCREFHEARLATLATAKGLSREAQSLIDHSMLLRAKEKYLFDATTNRSILSDDPWRRFLWDWIADAELAADDGGLLLGNMDLSYLGVYSIWTNDLGKKPATRLTSSSTMPDAAQWERAIGQYCKKRQLPDFDGAATSKPFQRQLCLEICGWGDPQRHDPNWIDGEAKVDDPAGIHTMVAARHLFRGDLDKAIQILRRAITTYPELLFVSLSLQLLGRDGKQFHPSNKDQLELELDDAVPSRTDPYLRAISSLIATGDWATVANQRSLPLSDRAFVAVRNFEDNQLTDWLHDNVALAVEDGDIEGIALTGITEHLVDIFARYVQKFQDVQTATLVLSIVHPRYIDDIRCRAWRNAYRSHLQRHRLFFQRTKFEVESTKRSKRDGVPTLKPPSRQIALRCVYCDAETSLASHGAVPAPAVPLSSMPTTLETRNPLLAASISSGISCPNCGRQLPRCVVCLEVVGVPRSDKPEDKDKESTRTAGRFPTFCLRCEHVLHLDHARQWFSRHVECPVPECRCQCNFRANPELGYH
ncbi:hypothetical protein E4U42_005266 [Claviceps africana]|uniref:Uncharacterized protein n=1 Tax=Claviceps africana TaxID=83212 RepID=A0A8K0J647_9HYPO|nr:hypothetical protein E4U42_005266 [Claviceps africana]